MDMELLMKPKNCIFMVVETANSSVTASFQTVMEIWQHYLL